jgi:chaperone BCS1
MKIFMLQLLKTLFAGQNQFASGGLMLMIVGGISVYLRAVPLRIWYWLVSQTTMMITVTDKDDAFVWVKEWFLEQEFLKRIRQVDLDTTLRGSALALIPAPGSHWFWHAGRPYVVYFYRSQDSKKWGTERSEQLTFQTIGRKQTVLRKFVDEVLQCHYKKEVVTSSLHVYHERWTRVQTYTPRLLDSVILEPGEKEHVLQDVTRFKASKARYARLGVPYHRGYLLYGPPGTGKTSLVSALAAKFFMSIYAVNLNDFNDGTLASAINAVPADSVVLFEDIDCMQSSKARVAEKEQAEKKDDPQDRMGVTLSGLLNVLDGFYAPENVLFVMTTNQIEALDAALLRPGRIDYKLYMGKATDRQKMELYRRFFPQASELEAQVFVESSRAETMAEFQGLLLGLEREQTSCELAEAVLQ